MNPHTHEGCAATKRIIESHRDTDAAYDQAYRWYMKKPNAPTADDVATAMYHAAQEMLDIVHLIATEQHSEDLFAERIGGSVSGE